MAPKINNFEIVRPSDIPHYSQFRQFPYSPFDINQFSQFLFPTSMTHKFDRSTYERSLIFKFETSAILKCYLFKILTLLQPPSNPWFVFSTPSVKEKANRSNCKQTDTISIYSGISRTVYEQCWERKRVKPWDSQWRLVVYCNLIEWNENRTYEQFVRSGAYSTVV